MGLSNSALWLGWAVKSLLFVWPAGFLAFLLVAFPQVSDKRVSIEVDRYVVDLVGNGLWLSLTKE